MGEYIAMFKIKIKRNLKFEKIRQGLSIKKGTSWLDDEYTYSTITDNAIVTYAIAVAAKYNAEISNYYSEKGISADIGCLTIYSTKSDFIAIVNELLSHFNKYISICQF